MEEQGIRLTPNILKTLGESTKIKILKELSSGPKIPADISKKLNKSAPTIIEHLEKLGSVGLVEKQERQGKKYVFYALTKTGIGLVSNESRLSIVLYSSISLFIIGISLFAIRSYSNINTIGTPMLTSSFPLSKSASNTPTILLNILPIIIIAGAFILLMIYARKLRQMNVRISD